MNDPKVRSTELVRLDYFYDRFRQRVEGLTDAEHRWEPVPGCLTVEAGDPGPVQRGTDAAGAIAYVEDSWARWQSLVGSLTPDELWEPIGAGGGPYGASARIELVLHLADELIHHAAEVGVLRDLYRAQP